MTLRRKGPSKRQQRSEFANDSDWRAAVLATTDGRCQLCGGTPVDADHIQPRAQGGKSDLGNGMPLCSAFSVANHHALRTANVLVLLPEDLTDLQREYLAGEGWVDWDEHGEPFGRGHRHFAPAF